MLLAWNAGLTYVLTRKTTSEKKDTAQEQSEYTLTDYTSDLSAMVANVRASVVQVVSSTRGSGVIFGSDEGNAYIVTCKSVVNDNDAASVYFDSGVEIDGTVIGRDDGTGIAVIKVPVSFAVTVFTKGDSDSVSAGEYVSSLSGRNPDTGRMGVAFGTASDAGMGRVTSSTLWHAQLIETDIRLANSAIGGPLCDGGGALLGMMLDSVENGETSRSYAIGVSDVQKAYDEILKDGSVSRGCLPITGINLSDLRQYQKSERGLNLDSSRGILVNSAGGSAQDILQTNDVIVAVNGTRTDNLKELRSVLYDCASGQELSLTIIRDGSQMDVSVIAE